MSPSPNQLPWWTWTWPLLALVVLGLQFAIGSGGPLTAIEVFVLVATVFAAVHHAEVVALRVGEPFGTLVLALAVTVIEVALIVSVMISGGPEKAGLARDTVFAVVMLVCNGIVGLCLLLGAVRHREQVFHLQGANAALAVLIAMTSLTLIFPNLTITAPGPAFSNSQLIFASIVSLVLYGSFLFIQTIRHRDYFLAVADGDHDVEATPPTKKITFFSSGLLFVCLVAVVALAKVLTPVVEFGIERLGAPRELVGVVIAAVVLLPEGTAAMRAAAANRLQTSINLALGSALASIGLTIPAVAAVSILFHKPLTLGITPKEEILLALTLLTSVLTLGTGRTTVLQGIVHLVIFAVYLFFTIVP